MIFAHDVAELPAVRLADRGLRRRPDRGRIVADVVIAGQVAAGDGQGVVQALGECDVVAAGGAIEGDVAGIDDEIGPVSVEMVADRLEMAIRPGKRRPRWVSEICVRRNSDMARS